MLSESDKSLMSAAFNAIHNATSSIWELVTTDEDSTAYDMMTDGHGPFIASVRRLRFHYNIPYRDGTFPVKDIEPPPGL